MIYLTKEENYKYYGKGIGGLGIGRFNAEQRSEHSDDAYKYEFGYYNGHCLYAIIQKKSGGKISLEEASGMRMINGKGVWSLNTVLDPAKNALEIQAILDDHSKSLGYFYAPTQDDRFKNSLICVHQKTRKQLVIYHPKWRPDLEQIEANPL